MFKRSYTTLTRCTMYVIFFLISFMFYIENSSGQNTCEFRTTCRECIRDPHGCAWCTTEKLTTPRCTSVNDPNSLCKEQDIQDPQGAVEPNKPLDFSDTSGNYRQLQPTEVEISLRPGAPQEFTYHFKPAKDYPLDLYFLIDFSNSMDEVVAKTAQQNISNGLRDLTNNVYLGLGSFIDKKAVPYTLNANDYTYSFKHHLNLTGDPTAFSNAVNLSRLGQNYDASEGGFDALAQVMACKSIIGWREGSRKIVIFLTDRGYHVAGDGKWAGIFTPYDGKCHMENDQYTKELEMDYPSVSHLNKLAKEQQITIFFAILHEEAYNEYNLLKTSISGSLCEKLEKNSQTFVNQIHNMYKSLSESLSMELNIDESDHKYLDVKIHPDCIGSRALSNDQCRLPSGNRGIKNFTAKVTLKEYYGVDEINFSIKCTGFMEKLDVKIKVINDCECEGKGIENSATCKEHGTYRCGICECESDRWGDKCQCTGNEDDSDNSTCIARGSNLVCSGGRGACKCGKCECYSGYEGQYCEFSKGDCPGKTRGGPCSMHGTCQLGFCLCHFGWTGEKCDCPTSTELCQHANDQVTSCDRECSGLGDCVCGKCHCHKMASWDSRRQNNEFCYLEQCPECHEQQCQALETCVLCHHKNMNPHETCIQKCHNDFVIRKMEGIMSLTKPWELCRLKTDVGCFTYFAYQYYGTHSLEVVVAAEHDCMESYYVFGGAALGIVLVIGLLTLIAWKVLTTVRDRRDYAQFKKQHSAAEWEDGNNPIYESPNTTFYNPAFGHN